MRVLLKLLLYTILILLPTRAIAPVITDGESYDQMLKWQENHRVNQLKQKIDTADFSQELFYQALILYVDNPEIVFNQAIIESGWFGSTLFLRHNNPFGMKYAVTRESTAAYRARIGSVRNYSGYNHWSEAVKDIALWQEYWGVRAKSQEEYYSFLKHLPYATAKNYVKILKRMET